MTMGYLAVLFCCFGLLPHIHSKSSSSCYDTYGPHCFGCNDNECTTCVTGYCGSSCEDNCIGHCGYTCHKTNCSCEACADGYHGDGCLSPCSGRCYKLEDDDPSKAALCQRNGTCSEGCKYGFCLPNTRCAKRCNEGCLDDDCDADTCECRSGCKPGFDSCNETSKLPSDTDCKNCKNQTCKGDVCIGCIDGRHGVQCQHKCDNCEVCYQLDGTCIQVNQNSWHWCWTWAGLASVCCIILGAYIALRDRL